MGIEVAQPSSREHRQRRARSGRASGDRSSRARRADGPSRPASPIRDQAPSPFATPGDRAVFALTLVATTLFGHFVFHDSLSGDASIYFGYFRRFFELPFSFQPGTVSHGASSPLHVVVGALAHRLWPEGWLEALRVFGSLCLAGGLAFVRATLPAGRRIDVLLCALALWMHHLWITSAQAYETSLAFLGCAALYHALRSGRDRRASALAGALVLARPELALVGLAAGIHLGRRSRWGSRFWFTTLAGWSPFVLWAVYMHAHTGEWIPSNVLARGLESRYGDVAWTAKLAGSLWAVGWHAPWMAFGLAVLGWRALRRDRRVGAAECLIALPLVAVYVARPPGSFLVRYWLPLLPVVLPAAVTGIEWWFERFASCAEGRLGSRSTPASGAAIARREHAGRSTRARLLALATIGLLVASLVAALRVPPRIAGRDLDTRLLRDLGEVLDQHAVPGDRVLTYEIQGQYWTDRFCISLDGIVGRQMHDALRGRTSFADVITREGIDFVVTMNALNYRPIFAGSPLIALYEHDLAAPVGGAIELDGLRFEKLATNPIFARAERHEAVAWPRLSLGDTLRLYPSDHEAWAGHHPLWNSLYRVERVGAAGAR